MAKPWKTTKVVDMTGIRVGMRLAIVLAAALCACNAQQTPTTARHRTDTLAFVPDFPPESIPIATWKAMHSPDNMEKSSPEWGTPFPRNIVMVMFYEQTSRDEKQRAVDAVGGVVVGGGRLSKGGYYYISIQDDGTAASLFRAIEKLKSFAWVQTATPVLAERSPLEDGPRY